MNDFVERLRTSDIYDYANADKMCREAAARIAELEAALNDIIDKTGRAHPMSYVADIWRIARAALEGGEDA